MFSFSGWSVQCWISTLQTTQGVKPDPSNKEKGSCDENFIKCNCALLTGQSLDDEEYGREEDGSIDTEAFGVTQSLGVSYHHPFSLWLDPDLFHSDHPHHLAIHVVIHNQDEIEGSRRRLSKNEVLSIMWTMFDCSKVIMNALSICTTITVNIIKVPSLQIQPCGQEGDNKRVRSFLNLNSEHVSTALSKGQDQERYSYGSPKVSRFSSRHTAILV